MGRDGGQKIMGTMGHSHRWHGIVKLLFRVVMNGLEVVKMGRRGARFPEVRICTVQEAKCSVSTQSVGL